MTDLLPGLDEWLPVVRRLRPERPWGKVVRAVNAALPGGPPRWTQDRLVRAVGRLAAEGLVAPALLAPAPRRQPADRLVAIVAGIARAAPHLTLRAIAAELPACARKPRAAARTGLPPRSRICWSEPARPGWWRGDHADLGLGVGTSPSTPNYGTLFQHTR